MEFVYLCHYLKGVLHMFALRLEAITTRVEAIAHVCYRLLPRARGAGTTAWMDRTMYNFLSCFSLCLHVTVERIPRMVCDVSKSFAASWLHHGALGPELVLQILSM